jgi:cell division septum initiation protein DivIVA
VEELSKFRTARRNGYDTEDVSRAFADITSRVERIEADRISAEKTADRLARELAEARATLKRASSKPTFADLGSAFEQTLRVAEEQASNMVQDSVAEAAVRRENARAVGEELTRSSRLRSEQLVAEAEAQAEELRVENKRRSMELIASAEAKQIEANTSTETAQRKAAGLVADAEREAADINSALHQEAEDVKTELSLLRQIAEREQLRIVREIRVAADQDERNRLALHEEAVAHVQSVTEQAALKVRDAADVAAQISNEAELFYAGARADSEALLANARETAKGLIARARSRAERLTTRYNEHASAIMADTEQRMAWLEEQQGALASFSHELRSMASSDSLVALDESASSK